MSFSDALDHLQRNKTRYGAILIGLGGMLVADVEGMKIAGHMQVAFWLGYIGPKLVWIGGILAGTGMVKSDQYYKDKEDKAVTGVTPVHAEDVEDIKEDLAATKKLDK